MSGAFTEDPTLPDPDPEWLKRFEAKMAELAKAREERIAEAEKRSDEED